MSASFDIRAYRDALARFATGVTIVTTRAADGRPLGLTVNSFTSVSLNPPLILWCLDRITPEYFDYRDCGHFAIGVMAAGQDALAWHFASLEADKFVDRPWQPGIGGVPLLDGMLATFQCANRRQMDAGDHLILLGEVLAFERRGGAPLLFVDGALTRLPTDS